MRSSQIDFFRGLALIIIFIDHVYNNRLGGYTLRGFGITDAAEIFFFCSGFVSCLVYTRIFDRAGFSSVQVKATRRAILIYFFHIITFLLLIGITVLLKDINGVDSVLRARGLYEVIYDKSTIGLHIFTLGYQPFLFTILPAYIILSISTPLLIWLLDRSPWLLFSVSAVIYLMVQLFPGFNLIQWPYGSPWTFNPFAYQFLFVLGMLFGYLSSTGKLKIPFNYPVLFIAVLLLLATFIFHNFIPFLQKHFLLFTSYPLHNGLPLTGKINEEPLRIFHFMVLMYVVVFVIDFTRSQRPSLVGHIKKLAQPIISCGQNSIYIFSLGILLSYLGGYVLAYFGNSAMVWVPVNITGIAILLLVGTWLTSRKKEKCR